MFQSSRSALRANYRRALGSLRNQRTHGRNFATGSGATRRDMARKGRIYLLAGGVLAAGPALLLFRLNNDDAFRREFESEYPMPLKALQQMGLVSEPLGKSMTSVPLEVHEMTPPSLMKEEAVPTATEVQSEEDDSSEGIKAADTVHSDDAPTEDHKEELSQDSDVVDEASLIPEAPETDDTSGTEELEDSIAEAAHISSTPDQPVVPPQIVEEPEYDDDHEEKGESDSTDGVTEDSSETASVEEPTTPDSHAEPGLTAEDVEDVLMTESIATVLSSVAEVGDLLEEAEPSEPSGDEPSAVQGGEDSEDSLDSPASSNAEEASTAAAEENPAEENNQEGGDNESEEETEDADDIAEEEIAELMEESDDPNSFDLTFGSVEDWSTQKLQTAREVYALVTKRPVGSHDVEVLTDGFLVWMFSRFPFDTYASMKESKTVSKDELEKFLNVWFVGNVRVLYNIQRDTLSTLDDTVESNANAKHELVELGLNLSASHEEAMKLEAEKHAMEVRLMQQHLLARVEEEHSERRGQIDILEASVSALGDLMEEHSNYEQTSQKIHSLCSAILTLSCSLESGSSITNAVSAVAAASTSAHDELVSMTVATIPQAVVDNGVPTLYALHSRFKAVRAEARKMSFYPVDSGVLGYLYAKFMHAVTIDESGMIDGNSASAVLSRVEEWLSRGDLASAVSEIEDNESLDPRVKAVCADWLNECKNRLLALQAMEILTAHASLLSESLK